MYVNIEYVINNKDKEKQCAKKNTLKGMVRKLTWNTRKGKPSSPKDGVKRTEISPENTDWNIIINIKMAP